MLLVLLVFLLVVPSKLQDMHDALVAPSTPNAACKDGWTGPKCIKTGKSWDDPHYETFDGKHYDFMGLNKYILAKDCENETFEVVQQNEICSLSFKYSCTKSVKVLFGATEIMFKRVSNTWAGEVYVNESAVEFPWTDQCKSDYVAHGDACYKKMEMQPNYLIECPAGEEFMVPQNKDENEFVYERFVKSYTLPFWINVRINGSKLTAKDGRKLDYSNFAEGIPEGSDSCITMTNTTAFWTESDRCGRRFFYICKYNSTTEINITKDGEEVTLDVPFLNFAVRWNGVTRVEVDINQRYEGKMCGLLGNADGNKYNDITTSNTAFANSWESEEKPLVVEGRSARPVPCEDLTQLQYNEIKRKCEKMKQPPFRKCNEKIAPDVVYIHDCEDDLCAMQQNDPSAAWCEALENYEETCRESEGINIDWRGEAAFKECGYPCAKMPCYNGAKCENIGGKEFKCFCTPGFSGLTCENVGD